MNQKQAVRQLLTSLSPADVVKLVESEGQCALHDAEDAKTHPLVGFKMADADFETLCAHLTDGGGVTLDMVATSGDGKALTLIVWQAIHDRDQKAFWRNMPHLLKSWVAQRDLIAQVPGAPGATITKGINVTADLPAQPAVRQLS